MEQQKPINHIVAGLIIAGVMVIFLLVSNMFGQAQNQALGWLTYLVMIAALIFFIRKWGQAHDYRLSFGALFSYGFKITSILTLIVIIFLVILFSAFPEMKDTLLEASRTAMEQQGTVSDEMIDQAMEQMDKYFVPITAGSALLTYLVLGLIGSLIGAAVTKKVPQNPFDQQPL